MIHCGSRWLGHQTCTDYVKIMLPKLPEWGITLPDRDLICGPFSSPEWQDYFAAMAAASNFAWANRHLIAHWVREGWHKVLGNSTKVDMVYDISNNISSREMHEIDWKQKSVIVHRKGATRLFGHGFEDLPDAYKAVG